MVTQLNELRPLAEVDCYKGRPWITFSVNFGPTTRNSDSGYKAVLYTCKKMAVKIFLLVLTSF